MKVLLVTHRYPPDGIGGVERYVEAVAERLPSRGCEVAVLTRTPRRFPLRPKLAKDDGAEVWRIVGSGVRLENFLVEAERTEQLTQTLLAEIKPDVVHVNQFIGISPRLVSSAQRNGAAVVLTLHDYYAPCPLVHLTKKSGTACSGPDEGRECGRTCFADERIPSRWLIRYRYFQQLLAEPEHVHAPSEQLAEWACAMNPVLRPTILPLGVASASTFPTPPPALKLRVGVFGSIAPHKGLDTLVAALALLPDSVEVVIAGRAVDEGYRDRLAATLVRHGVAASWRGDYGPTDLEELLGSVDVVVAASSVPEAFPLAPREALTHGVPVIAARVPGLRDVVEDGVNGALFAAGDPRDLARVLEDVLAEPSSLTRLREGARATRIVSHESHVDALVALYDQACRGPRTPEGVRVELDVLHGIAVSAGFASRRWARSLLPARLQSWDFLRKDRIVDRRS